MKWPVLFLAGIVLANFFFAAGFSPLLDPLLYTMTPLERYYAGDYLASTWNGNDPSATTETRLLWKTRPVADPTTKTKTKKPESKYETEFATEGDVELRPLGDRIGKHLPEPFALSDQARAQGWAAVYRGRPQTVQSAKLEDILREEVYGGENLWRFFVQPMAGVGGLMVLALALRLWRRRLLAQHPWRSGREAAWLAVRDWTASSASRLSEGIHQPMRVRELEGAKPETRRELPAPMPASATAPMPDRNPLSSVAPKQAVPESLSSTPQSAAVPPTAPSRKAYVWDASEGID